MIEAGIKGLLMGTAAGFVLHRSGLTRYSRIAGALLLQDLKAIKFMFGALAAAMLAYGLAAAWSVPVTPRVNAYVGPAHLLGGVLFGVGMGAAGF